MAYDEEAINLARGCTAGAYRAVERARTMTGEGVTTGKDEWMAEASALIDDMAFELEMLAWWVPEMVTVDRQRAFNEYRDQRKASL